MKKSKLIIMTLGVCLAGLIAAQPVLAADDPLEAVTKGKIQFGIDNDSEENTTVPDEEGNPPKEIVVDPEKDGSEHKKGVLRIQFAPHFNFGTYSGFTAKEARKYAEVIGYTEDGERKPIAPFVQIGEFRGKGEWKLEVSATEFVNPLKPTDKLEGAYINLPGSTLTMERETTEEAGKFVKGQKEGKDTKILTTGAKTHIMESIEGTTVTGYKVSNVFHDDYEKGMTYEKDELAGVAKGETSGVEFVKPEGKAPTLDAVYQSTLTWTLADTL